MQQQLDEPNEHEKGNEANATPHKLARETDDPRTSPAPALALEHLLAPKRSPISGRAGTRLILH
jgi:hypothetical protein